MMNRLQSELHRLYLPRGATDVVHVDASPSLVDARGLTRALVLEIGHAAGWDAVARVWRGCQLELELPAPAIAVSGADGFQVWFSLAEAVPIPEAQSFLQDLRMHFLPELDPRQVRALPAIDPTSSGHTVHAALVPAPQATQERWSAFVAPDLAPLFAETPWLDIEPGIDGQAELLCRLASIGTAEFDAAAARLRQALVPTDIVAAAAVATAGAPADTGPDPRGFLLSVMRDETVALALRIEAAKALLAHADRAAHQRGD